MKLDASLFAKRYNQLCYKAYSTYPETKPSFTEGLWDDEEGYKRSISINGRQALQLETWKENRDNPAYIIKQAMQPFGVVAEDLNMMQNLVSQQSINAVTEVFYNYPKESAEALYSIFFEEDEEKAFTTFAKLISKKSFYDPVSVVSFYYFLKDPKRYVPARRSGTGERLTKLGLSPLCVQSCSWTKYQEYLTYVHEIQELLLPLQPEATFLDAQSFLWMMGMIDSDTPEYKGEPKQRILFCNIAYMDSYDHIFDPTDIPKFGGSYVADTGSAFESWNFHRYDDGFYYGFVETKYTGQTAVQENARQLKVERIDSSVKDKDSVDGVTVIFCAHSELQEATVIVGWYQNATVLRYREKYTDGHIYNIKAPKATLLPEVLRTKAIPRAKKDGIGFGQSNVWYAQEEKAKEVVLDVLAFISNFSDEKDIVEASNEVLAEIDSKKLVALADQNNEPASVYTTITTLRKRNPYLPEVAKRRAKGICQLCEKKAPFLDSKGKPYLEAHHIIPLADDGPDVLSNIVALCPNCHRKMHVVQDPDDIAKLCHSVKEHDNNGILE